MAVPALHIPPIDLPKLAGSAASAVGLIIASTILVSFVSGRYIPAFERYRSLTDSLRGFHDQNTRRHSLRQQVREYRRRLRCLSRASELLCWVMVLAVATVVLAGVSTVFPGNAVLDLVGSVCLLLTLSLDVFAVALVMIENRIDRRAIEAEAMDLDEVNGGEPPDRAAAPPAERRAGIGS